MSLFYIYKNKKGAKKMKEIYPAQANSPAAMLSDSITAEATSITLSDADILPTAPNIAVIGSSDNAETIIYTAKSGNQLTGVTRGVEGAAKAWPSGTIIARNFTAYDYNSLVENVGQKANLDSSGKLNSQEVPDIDCGVWVTDPVMIHNNDSAAHKNMKADGNNTQSADTSSSLEEHIASPQAHQNLIIDGNES